MSIDFPKRVSPSAAAWDDLVEGMSKSWMWSAMAMQDIRMRYRGSLLGPFWLTISMVIMIAAMGRNLCSSVQHGNPPATCLS